MLDAYPAGLYSFCEKVGAAAMRAGGGAMTVEAERAELWRRVEARLPQPVGRALGNALRRRVLKAPEDPLRNRLVRKLLRGYDTHLLEEQLEEQFQGAEALLTNWDQLARVMRRRSGRDFDTGLRPWMAEVRALDFLGKERGVPRATALRHDGSDTTPDFLVHRNNGDGLAEVKLISPNDNYEVIEEEFEIAVLRKPDVFNRHRFVLETPDDLAVTLSAEGSAIAAFMEVVWDAIRTGRSRAAHCWRSADGNGHSLVAEIEPADKFGLMGAGVGGILDEAFYRRWLNPFSARVDQRAKEALAQMHGYEARTGRRYGEKDIVIYYNEPGASPASLLLADAVAAIKAEIAQKLRALDPTVTLSVRG